MGWKRSVLANVSTNNLLGVRQEVISQKKQTNKYKENLIILQSIGIIHVVIKSKETRAVTYTCRYSSGTRLNFRD